jgi:hypothetical protein
MAPNSAGWNSMTLAITLEDARLGGMVEHSCSMVE